jgi:hypothetical protein
MDEKLPGGQAPTDSGLVAPQGSAAAPAIDPGAFADAHRQLLGDSTIQFDLNPPDQPPPQQQPNWDLSGLMPVLQALFWIALAAFALFILYWIAMRLTGREWSWRRKAKAEEADESWRPEAGEARELLSEADALAARGLYAEAARLILYRSIEDIDDKRPDLVRPALTSRDICALEEIPGRPRSAFARIAAMVERSLFAGRPLVSGDWTDCRAAYEEFAFAEGWSR